MSYDQIKSFEQECREKDAEIERLKTELRKVETLWFSEDYRMQDHMSAKDAEIERLKREIEAKDAEVAQLKKLNLMTDEQVVLELKEEIERLKEQNESDYKITVDVCNENTDLKKLIAELADALDVEHKLWTMGHEEYSALLQKAREAVGQTNCR